MVLDMARSKNKKSPYGPECVEEILQESRSQDDILQVFTMDF